jgi:DNA-binding response OmpR family regulator
MAEWVPDLAILDVDMPDMNGLALLSEMQRDDRLKKVPVIFLTVKTTVADETQGLKAGVIDYIRKEVLMPDRVDILRYRVRNFFVHQENERLRGVLATIVSANHEINNPMMVVLGNVDLMQVKGWVNNTPEAQMSIERIIDAGRQIKSVMMRIATLTHFEVKTYLFGVEMLDLNASSENV